MPNGRMKGFLCPKEPAALRLPVFSLSSTDECSPAWSRNAQKPKAPSMEVRTGPKEHWSPTKFKAAVKP